MEVEGLLERRAAVHAALGDPARLAIADALISADAAPSELGRRLGIGSNLLAHHIKVLERASVVRRLRSEGDRRRSYVTLQPDALSALAAETTFHAARVLFVCSRNSARSQLAAALWAGHSSVPATSAGTRPADRVHPGAVAAAHRHGLRLRQARTRRLDDVATTGDLMVAVCDQAHEELGELRRLHWSIPDPVRRGTDDAFDTALTQLSWRITRLARMVRTTDDHTDPST